MDRRHFNSLCTALLAGAASAHATTEGRRRAYTPSRLMHDDEHPVTVDSLEVGSSHIFGYPYITTPCFLLKLGRSAPGKGSWPGGVGPNSSVVAFSAICSHKMTHPARPISHISYRHEPISFHDAAGMQQTREGLISCCSERSIYDPADGAAVLSGPARSPLAAIELSVADDGSLSATGSLGLDRYDEFLDKFGFRLAMEYGVSDVRQPAAQTALIVPADAFSMQQVLC